jgi:hypothetical protein
METIYTLHPTGLVSIAHREYEIESPTGEQTGLSFKFDERGYISGDGVPFGDENLMGLLREEIAKARASGLERTVRSGEARPIPKPLMSYKERQARVKAHDRVYNEGGEGYNPYR